MCRREAIADLRAHLNQLPQWELAALKDSRQCLAVDQLRDDKRNATFGADLVNANNIGMV